MFTRLRGAWRFYRDRDAVSFQSPPAGMGALVLLREGMYVHALIEANMVANPEMIGRGAMEMARAMEDAINPPADIPVAEDDVLCEGGEACGGPEDCICAGTCRCEEGDDDAVQ